MNDEATSKFLTNKCGIKEFVLDSGICYSQNWLSQCTNEFRDKIVSDIFLQNNSAKTKKKNKKEKQHSITEEEVIDTVTDSGLASHSSIERIAGSLAPLITQQFLKLKLQLDE
jgi:vacuolar-type H+-ATPase catalytic subunit A/Vma1